MTSTTVTKPNNSEDLVSLYGEHHGWLCGWLMKRLGCSYNAADLTQDTFERVISRTDLSVVKEPRPWLLTISKRIMIDKSRRAKVEQAYLAECAQLAQDNPLLVPSSEQIFSAVQILGVISSALEGVPEKAQQAFIFRFIDGLTLADTAEKLSVSHTMVRKYLVQCLAACHDIFEGVNNE